MPSPLSVANALQHLRAGNLSAAETICRQVLAHDPEQIDALHFLGIVMHQTGRNDLAVHYFSRAIDLNEKEPAFHSNLGTVYRALGQLENAMICFKRAVELNPDFAEAYCSLGTLHQVQGKL